MKYQKNMMRRAVFAALLCFGCSCTAEWLDIKTDQSMAVPVSLEDFQGLIDDYNVMNASVPASGEIAADGHYLVDQVWQGSMYDSERNAYAWTNAYFGTDAEPYEWSPSYKKILYSNIVLASIRNLADPHSPESRYVKGQALFLRAKDHYHLSKLFAPPYHAQAAPAAGIPVRLSPDITIPVERSTNQDVYSFIINDLKLSIPLLPTLGLITRPTKGAAYALLARIYLDIQEYRSAFAYADSAIRLKPSLQDYNEIDLALDNLNAEKEIIYLEELFTYPALRQNYRVDRTLYETFEDHDLRKQAFFRVVDGQVSFKGNYNTRRPNYLFGGLAVDEMYLIRAEAAIRLDEVEKAKADLYVLLQHRWDNRVALPTFDGLANKDLLTWILFERRKELILRGVRWSDLRRLNGEPATAVTLSRVIDGETYLLEPGSHKYTFPIPMEIITKSGITQNPEWD